jgi:hypothetical protein
MDDFLDTTPDHKSRIADWVIDHRVPKSVEVIELKPGLFHVVLINAYCRAGRCWIYELVDIVSEEPFPFA